MTDEGAKALAAAIEKLAAALGGATAGGLGFGGIHIYHHGVNPQTTAGPFSLPPAAYGGGNTQRANSGCSS